MFTLAHLSDIHLSPMPRAKRRHLLSKRLLGYVNWHRGRKFVHRRDYLDLLTRDLIERKPDHVTVTGDLVNLGLPEEFLRAAEWLHHLGPPDHVTAIPGNHDAYVRLHPERGTRHWQPYMEGNAAGEALFRTPDTGFPFVRRYGDIAIVALSSAIPTMPFIAAGKLGRPQLDYLASALDTLGREGLFRVVLIHHPPLPGQAGWRRGLRDATKLREVLRAHGAELVLHGHDHAQTVHELDTASGTALIVGVPSASEAVEGQSPAARYNEYMIERSGDGWRVEMVGRAAASNEHVWECERRILRDR
ncbi:MAG: metallophosphoesterase family protein [Methyloceanibacter sp.]|uniref:metallophosphoesterase family protein n=1 Tax=Methyloceanibacter sp. TaxID=1965321 RepID=UPI003D6CAE5D